MGSCCAIRLQRLVKAPALPNPDGGCIAQSRRALRFCSGDVGAAATLVMEQRQQAEERRAQDARNLAAAEQVTTPSAQKLNFVSESCECVITQFVQWQRDVRMHRCAWWG